MKRYQFYNPMPRVNFRRLCRSSSRERFQWAIIATQFVFICSLWFGLRSNVLSHGPSRSIPINRSAGVSLLSNNSVTVLEPAQNLARDQRKFNKTAIRLMKKAINTNETRHVVFIRIPKTGSSTLTLLVWRFAWTRNLSVIAVKPKGEGTRPYLHEKWFYLPPAGQKYDVMAEHVLYKHSNFMNYLHADTLFTTILREPMSLLCSTLYYVDPIYKAIPGIDKLKGYLADPFKYKDVEIMADRSLLWNPQSGYFGLKQADFNNANKTKEMISAIDRHFPVVMILEKLDESLILFRRIAQWPIKDIIYSIQNVNTNKPKIAVTKEQRLEYSQLSASDHALYDYFLQKHKNQVKKAGPDFQEELSLFVRYKRSVQRFCRFKTITEETLYFPGTKFHASFTVDRKDCAFINVEPLVLISSIREKQGSVPFLSLHL